MNEQQEHNYQRIATAIAYIREHFTAQPSLEDIAAQVHLSPYHFQRLFTEWAGVSPKNFLQFISIGHAKQLLQDSHATLFQAAHETGLSGTGRLHDLFVKIEGMTPGEYKNKGRNLTIRYQYATTPFGQVLVASTDKGICYMGFSDQSGVAFGELSQRFPQATFLEQTDAHQQNALRIYSQDWEQLDQIKLHLKGTDFQLKVWEALLKIPMGSLATYGSIAQHIQRPKASRAVGGAVGSNPIAFLIPCHRVIQTSGNFGGYMWSPTRKTALIGWEASQVKAMRGAS